MEGEGVKPYYEHARESSLEEYRRQDELYFDSEDVDWDPQADAYYFVVVD